MGLALGLVLFAGTAKADEDSALYTMDNAAANNHVLIFRRGETGQLSNAGSIATGGSGTGAPQGLPSQSSVLLSHDGRWLFVCNAGSSEISVLGITPRGVSVTDKVFSGGSMPVSRAFLDQSGVAGSSGSGSHPTDMVQSRDGRFLYSLNNGNGTISAFGVGQNGSLHSLMTVAGLPTSSAGLAGR
jgi:6-phosphogluconolactonase (cycloisomerase 2 family)